ncbi:hypothetical protein JAAARDRAFT_39353 [Jaapia argillacea MUCL 33604]|uniref:Uncharacterized protein n=1 Tax=Jaapia argillacea MUCL 33604 TaxID=933084 RepID=A0A067PEQ5_9AGAM|nr:hypothetical protein JAAARDRAFT_39353 [Jaapia argillacea MUCL 33604]
MLWDPTSPSFVFTCDEDVLHASLDVHGIPHSSWSLNVLAESNLPIEPCPVLSLPSASASRTSAMAAFEVFESPQKKKSI